MSRESNANGSATLMRGKSRTCRYLAHSLSGLRLAAHQSGRAIAAAILNFDGYSSTESSMSLPFERFHFLSLAGE